MGGAITGFDHWEPPPTDPAIVELLPWNDWWSDFQAAVTSEAALEVFVDNGRCTRFFREFLARELLG